MIIIKIIILYFIQIRHTNDFPSTGTRLVIFNNTHSTDKKHLKRVVLISRNVHEHNYGLGHGAYHDLNYTF